MWNDKYIKEMKIVRNGRMTNMRYGKRGIIPKSNPINTGVGFGRIKVGRGWCHVGGGTGINIPIGRVVGNMATSMESRRKISINRWCACRKRGKIRALICVVTIFPA